MRIQDLINTAGCERGRREVGAKARPHNALVNSIAVATPSASCIVNVDTMRPEMRNAKRNINNAIFVWPGQAYILEKDQKTYFFRWCGSNFCVNFFFNVEILKFGALLRKS